jgi:hypothetical protein
VAQAEQTRISPDVMKLRDAISPDARKGEDITQQRISEALRNIGAQLYEWGTEMCRTAVYPDIATILEISNAIDELYPALNELIEWLRGKEKEMKWLSLQSSVEDALEKVPRTKIGPTLANYVIWRGHQENTEADKRKKPSPREREQYLKKQFFVGEEIIKLASALKCN